MANETVVIDVVGNDTDPASRSLELRSVTAPSRGVSEIATGMVAYTPAFGFVGRDTFTYTVANDLGLDADGTVTVDVKGHGGSFADGTWFTDGTGWTEQTTAAG
jgi:hypothetical protein